MLSTAALGLERTEGAVTPSAASACVPSPGSAAKSAPFAENGGARPNVIALEHNARAGSDTFHKADEPAAVVLGVFQHHYGVRALRQPAARWYGRALARAESKAGRLPHLDGSGQAQERGSGLAAAEGVGGKDGVAVHGGAVKARDEFTGQDVLGQHTAPS